MDPSAPPRIVSVEQDAHQAERTRGLLERAGLGVEAVVIVAPLAEQLIEGDVDDVLRAAATASRRRSAGAASTS